jgi:hypothetical protein
MYTHFPSHQMTDEKAMEELRVDIDAHTQKALTFVRKGVELGPEYPPAYKQLALCLQCVDKHEEAERMKRLYKRKLAAAKAKKEHDRREKIARLQAEAAYDAAIEKAAGLQATAGGGGILEITTIDEVELVISAAEDEDEAIDIGQDGSDALALHDPAGAGAGDAAPEEEEEEEDTDEEEAGGGDISTHAAEALVRKSSLDALTSGESGAQEMNAEMRALLVVPGRDGKPGSNIYSCGCNEFGQLGQRSFEESVNEPRAIPTFHGKQIILAACGREHGCVTTHKHELMVFGHHSRGQLGLGIVHPKRHIARDPQMVHLMRGKIITHLACGEYHTVAATTDGEVSPRQNARQNARQNDDDTNSGVSLLSS